MFSKSKPLPLWLQVANVVMVTYGTDAEAPVPRPVRIASTFNVLRRCVLPGVSAPRAHTIIMQLAGVFRSGSVTVSVLGMSFLKQIVLFLAHILMIMLNALLSKWLV